MRFKFVLVSALVIASAACGKGKDKEGGSSAAGGGGGGPACSEAAAAYAQAHVVGGGNRISGLNPSIEEIKTITAKFEADCTSRPWTADQKTCVMAIKHLLTDKPCFKGQDVAQMVFDTAQSITAARAAGGGSAAAGSAAGSAAPAGSAAAPTP